MSDATDYKRADNFRILDQYSFDPGQPSVFVSKGEDLLLSVFEPAKGKGSNAQVTEATDMCSFPVIWEPFEKSSKSRKRLHTHMTTQYSDLAHYRIHYVKGSSLKPFVTAVRSPAHPMSTAVQTKLTSAASDDHDFVFVENTETSDHSIQSGSHEQDGFSIKADDLRTSFVVKATVKQLQNMVKISSKNLFEIDMGLVVSATRKVSG